jgi:RNA 2',3'-cyclic 3'-phosphodiesterase
MEKKRLFFGFAVGAHLGPLPKGRLLLEEDRHATVAFLGSQDFEAVKKALEHLPLPPWKIGLAAIGTGTLFLPPRNPRCVSLEFALQESLEPFLAYQKELVSYLAGFINEKRPFLPHITLCRSPFYRREWKNHFKNVPLSINSLHLYESLGGSRYQKVWTHLILPPFEEICHTADIAFKVRGSNLQTLALHAFFALASIAPSLLKYEFKTEDLQNLEDVVAALNQKIAALDIEEGSPLKAVSYHGEFNNGEWEMIVDV